MEEYFKGFADDIFFLNYNSKGSTTTTITKWDIIRKLSKKIGIDEEPTDSHRSEPGVQLLPRQDIMLYGTIPKMEQRIYSKCKECRLVFNPRDILSHKNCSSKSSHLSHTSLLKKKVKSKSSSSKKTHSSSTIIPSSPPSASVFKRPPSPPPLSSVTSLPELKVTVTKVIIPKVSKVISVSASSSSTSTSFDKSDTRISSSSSKILSSLSSPRSPSKSSSHSHSSKSSSKSSPMDTLPVTTSSSLHSSSSTSTSSSGNSSSSSSNSRHKKSSKRSSTNSSSSSKIFPKEFDPDVHCGVVEGSRGPCTRSITCSNHRIQLRKLVSGRSKDIHQLIAERKAAKEKDLKHATPSCSYTPPNGEEKEMFCQNTSYVPIVAKLVTTTIESSPVTTSYVPIMPKVSTHTRQSTTSLLSAKKSLNVTENENESPKALTNGFISHTKNFESISQDSAVGTVPVVYMPMSPISVVSPVQFVKIGNNMICLESPQSAMSPPLKSKSVFLPIHSSHVNNSNVKIYKSHPKPIVLPNFGTRRVGGAILLANPRLESQRNELLTALTSKRKTVNNNRAISLLNHSNSPHRPNILKVKSGTKMNCKRPASDKLVTSDSKRLVPDVNGFILHADVSETADAPQSNNCIQEKIALLNMK